jgi:dienelactone hydrolase
VPTFVHCPECGHRFRLSASSRTSSVRCPSCGARVDSAIEEEADNEVQPSSRRGRSPRRSNRNKILIGVLLGCGTLIVLCAGVSAALWWWLFSPTSFPNQTEQYAQARQHFQTKLIHQGPAPQRWQREQPPGGVKEMEYVSGTLRLKAWVSAPPPEGGRRPAVLFLHGGFAFGADDWEQAQPFRDAGFVVMTPMMRGENGLPGFYSMFYNEVDDVLAAAEALARLPYVDGKRLYVAGHSVGGTLALLAALTSNRFRAAASFSGSPDQVAWASGQPEVVPFDPADKREFQMRSPLAFARSFQCPVRIYYGNQEFFFASNSQKTAQLAKAANLDVEAVSVPGDHLSSVSPAMRQCIPFFQKMP